MIMALRGAFSDVFFIVWPAIDASNVCQYHMRDVESQRAGRYISSGVEGIVRHDL